MATFAPPIDSDPLLVLSRNNAQDVSHFYCGPLTPCRRLRKS